jgi:hypothetical protein
MRTALSLVLAPLLLTGGSTPSPINQVAVIATDYAFQVPAELPPGATAFRLTNNGKQFHEFNVTLLKHGVAIDDFIGALKKGQPVSPLREGPVGVLFADPGTSSPSQLTTQLLPGRDYAIICNFQDNPKAPQHYALGMYRLVHVRGAAPPLAMAVAAPVRRDGFSLDTIVATDYAFQYPHTVTKGPHTFLFRNDGKVRHEFNMVLLKKGSTLQTMFDLEKAGKDPFSAIDSAPGVLFSTAGSTPFGQIDVDLLPGRDYAILCTFSNDDKSPPHYKMGMFGTIHVEDR